MSSCAQRRYRSVRRELRSSGALSKAPQGSRPRSGRYDPKRSAGPEPATAMPGDYVPLPPRVKENSPHRSYRSGAPPARSNLWCREKPLQRTNPCPPNHIPPHPTPLHPAPRPGSPHSKKQKPPSPRLSKTNHLAPMPKYPLPFPFWEAIVSRSESTDPATREIPARSRMPCPARNRVTAAHTRVLQNSPRSGYQGHVVH